MDESSILCRSEIFKHSALAVAGQRLSHRESIRNRRRRQDRVSTSFEERSGGLLAAGILSLV